MFRFRYYSISFLLGIGLFLSFLLLINGAFVISRITQHTESYDYEYYESITCLFSDVLYNVDEYGNPVTRYTGKEMLDSEHLFSFFCKENSAEVSLVSTHTIGDGDYAVRAALILSEASEKDALFQDHLSDHVISGGENGIVYVGTILFNFAKKTEEGYLLIIDGEYYTIGGVYFQEGLGAPDDRLYIEGKSLSETGKKTLLNHMQENLREGGAYLQVKSDDKKVIDEVWEKTRRNNDYLGLVLAPEIKCFSEIDRRVAEERKIGFQPIFLLYYGIMVIFSIGNLMTILHLYLRVRQREIIIRRAYGMGISQIVFLVMKDIIVIGLPASVFAMFAEAFVIKFKLLGIEPIGNSFFSGILLFFVFFGILFFAMTGVVMKQYSLITPAKELNR